MERQTQLYFWDKLVKKHKDELSVVKEYFERTKVVFNNIESDAEKHAEFIYLNTSGTEDDQASLAEFAEEKGYELYETLALMKSNHLLMTISMLYHIWEQQLIKFCIKELSNDIKFEKKSLEYSDVKNIFEIHGIKIEEKKSWKKLRELKALVNTIKHGDGDSANKLRKIRPDFFKIDFLEDTDTLELHESVLLDEYSLQVEESDFYDYIRATKEFWDEMPERAYADVAGVLEKLNNKNKKNRK